MVANPIGTITVDRIEAAAHRRRYRMIIGIAVDLDQGKSLLRHPRSILTLHSTSDLIGTHHHQNIHAVTDTAIVRVHGKESL